MPEVKCLVLDAIEYHNNPHLQPLMSSEATEMRGAQDVVMMISALEDANLVQYKVCTTKEGMGDMGCYPCHANVSCI